jgi:hypothetical protein
LTIGKSKEFQAGMHSFALPSLRKSTAQIQLQLNSPTDSGEDPI